MLRTSAALVIRLFAQARVTGEPSLDVTPNGKALALLAYLLLHRDTNVTRESAAFALWPDEGEDAARANLRRALYLLQHALPPGEWILVQKRTIAWNPEASYWLDVQEYERLLREQRPLDAIELYAGDLLPQLEDEWLIAERERLREMQLRISRDAVASLRERGDYRRAIEIAKRALRIDPWHEDVLRELIAARAQSGDRAGALREYRTFEDLLKREIGAEPMPETVAAAKSVAEAVTPAPARTSGLPRVHNLPAPISSFVGRASELEHLERMIFEQRLITLVGAGGAGKTRLALRAAERSLPGFEDGVWYVDLAPIDEPRFLTTVVATTLGVPKPEGDDLIARIVADISSRHVLLLLDNCDRLIGVCGDLAERILTACPNVTILATSREPLGLSGETVFDVPPLQEPDAVALFCQRIAATRQQFSLDEERAEAVRELCRRLDCIPLALELAAARGRVLSVAQISEHLADRFTLLKTTARMQTAHQQTLRGAIDWSYELLSGAQRRFLTYLSVFAGSCSLEAIRAVCAPDDPPAQVLDRLSALLDKSLVIADRRRDETRYRLLESIREYSLEKLDNSGEAEAARQRHLVFFTEFAERLEPELTGPEQRAAMHALMREVDNMRAAFAWKSVDPGVAVMRLRLATAIRWFYWFRSLFGLARARLSESLSIAGFAHTVPYAKALSCYGFFALQQGDLDEAVSSLERALSAYEGTGAESESLLASIHLALARMFRGDRDHDDDVRNALNRARSNGDAWLLSYALAAAGMQAALERHPSESIAFFRESVEMCEAMGESYQGAFWLLNLAVQQYHVAPQSACGLFVRCADRAVELQHERVVAGSFEGFGWCMQRAGETETAAELLGIADELRTRSGHALLLQWRAAHDYALIALNEALGAARLHLAWERGALRVRKETVAGIYASVRPHLAALTSDESSAPPEKD